MIAYIGTGLLGANFVRALLKKGNQVQVWNRTFAKAHALEADGAKAFENVAEAVKGADRIHITLSDDAAVDAVLEQAKSGFSPGDIIIDHTTVTSTGIAKRTKYWAGQGITYIHAPVFMGPQNALDSTGYMLISGDQELVEKLTPELAVMTGKLINMGPEPGKAAGMKLVGNLFLITITSGLADALTLAKALHIPASDVAALFSEWNPGTSVPGRMKKITDAQYDKATWELNMARKDVRLMMEETTAAGEQLTMIPMIAKIMDEWIAKGFGRYDWTVIAKDSIA
jgi:3-hydroxyisobutyrate dehydrogenase